MVWFLAAAIVAGVFHSKILSVALAAGLAARAAILGSWSAWAWIPLAVACGGVGAAAMGRMQDDGAHVARVAAGNGGAAMVLRGRVVSFPANLPFGTSFIYETDVGGRRVRLLAQASFFDVDYGDVLEGAARVAARADDGYLLSRGVAGKVRMRLRDVSRVEPGFTFPSHRRAFWSLHRAARVSLSRAMSRDAALPLGLMLGERGHIEKPVREAVIRLGIAHLLALSGMHLGVIAMFAVLLARAVPRRGDLILLLALTAYVGMVGEIESLSRAYLMAALLIAARALIRPLRPVDALGKALFVMLLLSPVSILSIGLQLSFAATLAVLLVIERFPASRRARPGNRAKRVFRAIGAGALGAFVISVAVEIVIAPLLFHHFGRMSVVGPVATVAFVIPVTVVQVLALISAPLAGAPVIGEAVVACLAWVSQATVAAVLAAGAAVPDPVAWAGPRPGPYYAALALAWRWPRSRVAWTIALALLAAAIIGR